MNSKEIVKSIDTLAKEKNIDHDIIFEALELALLAAYKKNFNSKTNAKVFIDRNEGTIRVYSYLVVVDEIDYGTESVDEEGNEVVIPPEINIDAQILLEDAQAMKSDVKIGDTIEKEVTPTDFDRVAAGTAKQVVIQKIREAEKEVVLKEFSDKEFELMLGLVAMEDERNYYIDLGKARGLLPKTEIIPGEEIVIGSNINVYITKIDSNNKGPVILLSRKNYGFVKRLFESVIPEVESGEIIIQSIVREAGVRSKVAVYSTNPNIDPIGACIGERGIRISNILKELQGERIDLVLYSEDDEEFIRNAFAPVKNVIVNIEEDKREALVIVNEEDLSLAIGKGGSNIKLASRLTKYRLELKSMDEVNEEGNL